MKINSLQILFILLGSSFSLDFNCGKDMKSVTYVNECTNQNMIDAGNATNNQYCCLLEINVGGSAKSLCIPVNSTNYGNIKNTTNNQSWPYNLKDNRYDYYVYCKEFSTSIYLIINSFFILFIIALLL
jgi:hypothetical protein